MIEITMINSKKLIYVFSFIGLISIFMIVVGVVSFNPEYGSDSIIFFSIVGLICVTSFSIAIYNFIMFFKGKHDIREEHEIQKSHDIQEMEKAPLIN